LAAASRARRQLWQLRRTRAWNLEQETTKKLNETHNFTSFDPLGNHR
jgi:hypothetical protein